jgi:hypothetical protein
VVRLGRETSTHYFSFLGGTSTDSKNSTSRHVTLNLCFASGRICGSRSAFRCVRDAKRQCTIFHARLGPVRIPQEHDRTRYNKLVFFHSVRIPEIVRWDTLHRTCVSTSDGICGSRAAFRCVRGTKRRLTIALARVGRVWIQQKARWDTLRRTCVSASGGICGHIVHCVLSEARNVDTLFFTLGSNRYGFQKKCIET